MNLTQNVTDGNATSNVTSSPLLAVVALGLANILAIIVGSWGNSLVVVVVICNRSLHSSTNFFIASLAAADLIVTAICIPIFFVYNVLTWPVWPFGSVVCRISSYLVHMSVMASTMSLLAISYDRFVAIFFPMKRIHNLRSAAKVVVAVIWCVSSLLLLPSLLHHDVKRTTYQGQPALMCVESWDTLELVHRYQLIRVSCYFLFVLQISILYFIIGCKLHKRELPGIHTYSVKAKLNLEKRKIIKMLFLVVLLFALCWLPYTINKLLNIFPPWVGYKSPDLFVFTGNLMGLLNSVANPFCYAALNKNFRTALKHALRCRCNHNIEERRRSVSALNNKNKSVLHSSNRRTSDSVFIDNRKTSTTSFIEGAEFHGAENAIGQVRGLSLASIETEFIAVTTSRRSRLSTDNNTKQNEGQRRVNFGPDTVQVINSRTRRASEETKKSSRKKRIGQGHRINSFSGIIHRASVSKLGPIEEGFVSLSSENNDKTNVGFESNGDLLSEWSESIEKM